MIKRKIFDSVNEWLIRNKIILILGPRQSGKTTLLNMIQDQFQGQSQYFNCDEQEPRTLLSSQNSAQLRSVIGQNKLILIDEAQRIENAGLNLRSSTTPCLISASWLQVHQHLSWQISSMTAHRPQNRIQPAALCL
jgi:predicted AAA+ superfamily ATPase